MDNAFDGWCTSLSVAVKCCPELTLVGNVAADRCNFDIMRNVSEFRT